VIGRSRLVVEPEAVKKGLFGADGCTRRGAATPTQPRIFSPVLLEGPNEWLRLVSVGSDVLLKARQPANIVIYTRGSVGFIS
jgi:hypothetical protein